MNKVSVTSRGRSSLVREIPDCRALQSKRIDPGNRATGSIGEGGYPASQPNRITLRIPPYRRIIFPLIVIEQPTRIRRLLAREAQREIKRHTIPIGITARRLIAKHLALVVPLPDCQITHRVDHHAQSAQVIGLDVSKLRHASCHHIDQRHRVVIQPDRLLLGLTRGRVVAQPLPGFVLDRDLRIPAFGRSQCTLAAMVVAVTFGHRPIPPDRIHAHWRRCR